MHMAPPRSYLLYSLLAAAWLGAGSATAFEQSSYYVFDIVETAGAKAKHDRLPVPKAAIEVKQDEIVETDILSETRSEFEIDYTQPIHSAPGSSFNVNLGDDNSGQSDKESRSYSTESFDFGTSNTVFGD